jgi:hypothetical protein
MDDRLSMRRMVAIIGVVLLVGVGLSVAPATLAQEGGSDAPTPGADGDINCGEFDNRQEVDEVFNPDNNEFGLDSDDDDIACEGVGDSPTPEEPGAAATETPTETVTATEAATETATPTETATSAETPESVEEIDYIAVVPVSSTVSVGDATELNVTFRDASGNILNITRNVTLTTDFGVFNESGTDTITLSTAATHGGSPAHAHTTLTSDEAGTANVTAQSDGISGATTITFVDNATEDGAAENDGGAAQGDELGQNDEDDDGDGHVDEDGEDGNDVPSNDDDDGDGAIDEDDESDDGDDGSDDFNGEAEDDDDGDGHFDEDDEDDGGNSDDEDNDGDGAVDEDDEPDNDD